MHGPGSAAEDSFRGHQLGEDQSAAEPEADGPEWGLGKSGHGGEDKRGIDDGIADLERKG